MNKTQTPVHSFEDLRIWQDSRILVKNIYQDIQAGPGAKNFGFKDQIHRAVISIMNNIAEGFERSTDADFARFLDISKGSSGEVRSMCYVAEDLGYFSPETSQAHRKDAAKISRGIATLTRHLRPQP